MSNRASSNGPGIGARPRAASQRSGRGMRVSVAAMRTARVVRLVRSRTLLIGLEDKAGRRLPKPAASLTAEARSLGRGRHAVRGRGRPMFRRRAARSSRTSSARAGRSTRTSVDAPPSGRPPLRTACRRALPRFQRPRRLAPLPLCQPAVVVVDVEAASGEPPLDEPTNRGAPTPAVQVAFADIPARIVDALKQRSLHGLDRSAARAAGTRAAFGTDAQGSW
jgi:hypothetical protein